MARDRRMSDPVRLGRLWGSPLALLNPDDHPGAVYIHDLERDHLGSAQARRCPVLEAFASPRKLPVVLSPEEVARFLEAARVATQPYRKSPRWLSSGPASARLVAVAPTGRPTSYTTLGDTTPQVLKSWDKSS
jgi:hypothetical protein